MDSDALFTIGAVAGRTGLTVKAIRFFAETGIVGRPGTKSITFGARCFDLSVDGLHTQSSKLDVIVGRVRSGQMALEDEVTGTARHFGVPFR